MMNIVKKMKRYVPVFVIFSLFLFLSFFFIYIGDDWAWGSQTGLDRLSIMFKDYNGRYLSNILIIILSRFNTLRCLVTSISVTAIILLIKKIAKVSNSFLLLIFLLVIAVPSKIFAQTIAWASGFVNYVFPVVFLLLFILLIKNINKKYICYESVLKNIGLIVFGAFISLFVEHVTIYNLILIIFLNIYSYLKYKKVSKSLVCYLIGSIVGTAIMFSNGAYFNVYSGNDFYRTAANNSSVFVKAFRAYFDVIYSNLIFNNYVLNVVLAVLIVLFNVKYSNSNNQRLSLVCLYYVVGFVFYSIIKLINLDWNIFGKYTIYFEGCLVLLYGLSILVIILLSKLDKSKKEKLVFCLGSVVFLTAPLLVVTPISPRCFFPMYILMILFVVLLAKYIDLFKYHEVIKGILLTLGICFFVHYLSIYSYNYIINNRRHVLINTQIEQNKEVIEVIELPYEQYLGWASFPNNMENVGHWKRIFKEFYGIDQNMNLVFKRR